MGIFPLAHAQKWYIMAELYNYTVEEFLFLFAFILLDIYVYLYIVFTV